MQRGLLIRLALSVSLLAATAVAQSKSQPNGTKLRFEVSFSGQQSSPPLEADCSLLSTDDKKEPRFEISDDPDTQQFFGADVDGLAPGKRRSWIQPPLVIPREPRLPYHRAIITFRDVEYLPDLSSRERPHRKASAGEGRGSTVEQQARKSLQQAAENPCRSRAMESSKSR